MLRCASGAAFAAFLLAGCSGGGGRPAGPPADSATAAAANARREAFLKDQAAKLERALESDRQRRDTVLIAQPTVVLYPPSSAAGDTSLRAFLGAVADTVTAAGWRFEERYGPVVRLVESGSGFWYDISVAAQPFGVIIVAPGHIPQVHSGLGAILELGTRLRTLRAWLPGGAPEPAAAS
jgi:hypothetical protein